MKNSKKTIAYILLLVLVLSIGSGCAAQSGSTKPDAEPAKTEAPADTSPEVKEVELDLWHTLTGDDGVVLGSMVEQFNKEYNGQIRVNVSAMNSSDFKAKLPLAIESKTGIPDLTVLTTGKLFQYGEEGLLTEMSDMMAEMGLDESSFVSATWKCGVFTDGSRYSIPLDAHAMLTYYNIDILQELGYTEDDMNGLDKETFERMCAEAQDAGYRGVGIWWGWMEYMFLTYLDQNGGELVSPDNPTEPLFNTQVGVDAIEYFKSLYDTGYTNEMDEHPETMFQQGDTLFCLTGTWTVSGMEAIDGLNWGITYLPKWGDNNHVWAGSHQLSMIKKEQSPERVDAMRTFIQWFSDHGAEWAMSGSVPARLDVLESDAYQALKWSFSEDGIDNFAFPPAIVTQSAVKTGIDANIYDYYLGNLPDAETALQRAYDEGLAKASK